MQFVSRSFDPKNKDHCDAVEKKLEFKIVKQEFLDFEKNSRRRSRTGPWCLSRNGNDRMRVKIARELSVYLALTLF